MTDEAQNLTVLPADSFTSEQIQPHAETKQEPMSSVETLLIADRHALTRSGIVAALSPLKECEVVAEAADFVSTMREIERHQPRLLLFEPRVLGENPTGVAIELHRIAPQTRQVIMLDERDSCCELTSRMHLSGGVMKFDEIQVVQKIIGEVVAGRPAFSDAYYASANSRKPCEALTDRERQIMAAILAGSTSRDVANKLGISVKTVENHRTNLMRKLNVHSVATLSQWARTNQCIYVS